MASTLGLVGYLYHYITFNNFLPYKYNVNASMDNGLDGNQWPRTMTKEIGRWRLAVKLNQYDTTEIIQLLMFKAYKKI